MEPRISLLTLGVRDLPRARAFYDAIGFKASTKSTDDVVFIQLSGGMALALWLWEELAKDAGTASQGSGFRGLALAHNVRAKDEVGVVMEEVRRAGGAIVKPAQDTVWGGHSGYFMDPDGYLWEVAFNPDTPDGIFALTD